MAIGLVRCLIHDAPVTISTKCRIQLTSLFVVIAFDAVLVTVIVVFIVVFMVILVVILC